MCREKMTTIMLRQEVAMLHAMSINMDVMEGGGWRDGEVTTFPLIGITDYKKTLLNYTLTLKNQQLLLTIYI